MTLVALLFAFAGFCLGLLFRPLTAGPAGRGEPAAAATLRELVAEHLWLARDRLGAAEARIALLEERLDFHEGFRRPPPSVWRTAADGVIPLRPHTHSSGSEESPNPHS